MLIGVKNRFVFVANSKAASTSIVKALTPFAEINRVGSPARKHIGWEAIRREYSFLFDCPGYAPDTFFKFGIIREPFDWLLSWYNYRRSNKSAAHPIPDHQSFVEFWKSNDWVKRITQTSHFSVGGTKCALDCLIPYDELSEGMQHVFTLLDIDIREIPFANRSQKRLYAQDISEEIKLTVRQHFATDNQLYQHWKSSFYTTMKMLKENRKNSLL